MRSNFYKWILVVLLLGSSLFDIITTIQHKNFLILESNFTFTFLNNIWILITFKILFCLFILVPLFRDWYAKGNFAKFFYVHLIILLIFGQCYAGFNNLLVKESVREQLNTHRGTNYTTVAEVPQEVIEENFDITTENKTRYYSRILGLLIYVPFFLALISFKFWEIIFLRKTNKYINKWYIEYEDE